MATDDFWIYYIVFDLLNDLENYQKDDGLFDANRTDQNHSYRTGDERSKDRHDRSDRRQKGNGESIRETENYKGNKHYYSEYQAFQALISYEIVK